MNGPRSRPHRPTRTPQDAFDDDDQWMDPFSSFDDAAVEALLSGSGASGPVASVIDRLRRAAADEPVPEMGPALRAQVQGRTAGAVTSRAIGRRVLLRVAAVAAVTGLLSVGAAQNRLPTSVQDVVSSTVELVGVHVPRTQERHPPQPEPAEDDDGASEGPSVTPGGATPAEPGTPGDREPATPATPPSHSKGTPGDPPSPPDHSKAGGNGGSGEVRSGGRG